MSIENHSKINNIPINNASRSQYIVTFNNNNTSQMNMNNNNLNGTLKLNNINTVHPSQHQQSSVIFIHQQNPPNTNIVVQHGLNNQHGMDLTSTNIQNGIISSHPNMIRQQTQTQQSQLVNVNRVNHPQILIHSNPSNSNINTKLNGHHCYLNQNQTQNRTQQNHIITTQSHLNNNIGQYAVKSNNNLRVNGILNGNTNTIKSTPNLTNSTTSNIGCNGTASQTQTIYFIPISSSTPTINNTINHHNGGNLKHGIPSISCGTTQSHHIHTTHSNPIPIPISTTNLSKLNIMNGNGINNSSNYNRTSATNIMNVNGLKLNEYINNHGVNSKPKLQLINNNSGEAGSEFTELSMTQSIYSTTTVPMVNTHCNINSNTGNGTSIIHNNKLNAFANTATSTSTVNNNTTITPSLHNNMSNMNLMDKRLFDNNIGFLGDINTGSVITQNPNPLNLNTSIPSIQAIQTEPEGAFKCKVCDKSFKRKTNLNAHAKIHTDYAYLCPYCNKKFARNGNLKQHIRIHTNERPFKCSYCVKAFRQKHSLQDHLRIHTGEKPFGCKYCSMKFAARCNLIVHERTHTGATPYQCQKCKKKYASKSGLNAHLKKFHL